MNSKGYKFYFGMIKIAFFVLAMIYLVIIKEDRIYGRQLIEIPLLLIAASALIIYELVFKFRFVFLGIAASVSGILIYFFGSAYCLLLPIIILDGITLMHLPFAFYFCAFAGIWGCDNRLIYSLGTLFFIALYYQHYVVIKKYIDYTESLQHKEETLLATIDKQDLRHKGAIEKFLLVHENERLEEKGRLSQALHDKIGHSINGSIFQLEACKLLIDHRPEQTKEKLQHVIENLRGSMDEIRAILRKEKPKPGEMKFVQLKKLCTDFKMKYNITVSFKCEGDPNSIPDIVWGLLLDNTLEAFSNALKYAACDEISIHIFVYNRLVRCSIKDNGKGCRVIKEGMGLSGMKERIRMIGGTIDFTSEPGFEINMLMPLGEGEECG